jgi:ESS family glutamate:Na+ symporter
MIEIPPFLSFNIAVILLLTGKAITLRTPFLQRYSIPDPVVGGILCAAVVAAVHFGLGRQVHFNLNVRDFLLLIFFAGVGLNSDIATLSKGGRPLLVLLGLATGFMIAQNVLGMAIASAFDLEPLAGLMAGSISLTGGVGTTAAWAPIFTERFGIHNAMEIGIASNMLGLISACVIGGPIAAFLMKRHGIKPARPAAKDASDENGLPSGHLDHFGMLWAILTLNLAVLLGTGLDTLIGWTGFTLPKFVSCLLAGMILRNLGAYLVGNLRPRNSEGIAEGLVLLSDLSLNLFLTMALMGLHLWALSDVFGFIATVITLQIAMTIGFAIWVVFRLMGRDYEATVITAGFGGIALGSTATAIANMSAVVQQHGPAHRAFIIVPIVCGFFIDIVNSFVIAAFVSL